MIVMISRTDILQEYLLPQSDGLDHDIVLEKKKYRFKKDITIQLEKTGGCWFVRKSDDYSIDGFNDGERLSIKGGDTLKFFTPEGESFRFIAVDSEIRFRVYNKYFIADQPLVTIGADPDSDIAYTFMNYVSKKHGRIISDNGRWVVEDISSNGIFVNDIRIKGTHILEFGDEINIFGLKIVFLGNIIAVGTHYGSVSVKNIKPSVIADTQTERADRRPQTDDKIFHRSPRNIPVIYNETIRIEAPPEPKFAKRKPLLAQIGPSFTMAIPMLLGCALAIYSSRLNGARSGAFMYTGLITAIGSAVFGSIWAIMNIRNERRDEIENEDYRVNAYGNYLIEISEKLRERYDHNRRALLTMYPSAEENCRLDSSNPLLWNRNRGHKDFLFYRLGLGNIPFQVKIEVPEERFSLNSDFLKEKPNLMRDDYRRLDNVPIGVDLNEQRLIGVIGGADCVGAIDVMYNIVAGIAANNCYTDVKMVFIYDADSVSSKEQWDFFKWLPHVWSENRKTRFVASDANECRDVFYELANVIRRREENISASGEKTAICKPHYVMFISDPALLENQLLAKYIYHPRKEYGLTAFIMAERYEDLPNECEYIIENSSNFKGIIHTMDSTADRVSVSFDPISVSALSDFAKRITELSVREFENDTEMPSSLDFFEMFGINSLEEFHVLDQWYKNRTYNSMKALIGKKAGGADCFLDLHEKFHGPHGLVAGTTGSGKSETLQTYILSLAINFSPDDIAFFIIDFKGGGMANLFTDLPHMAGQISNLSGNQVRRAMISIKSENRRRQRIFGEYGVNNINLYTRLYKSREAKIPIPHLIIIIDEFAELKREEPDFMRELISVAQVGRSLGVHLILATQKPNGTVDDNIRSNSKFHLCLRVQDRQDSNDMLHKPDAAYITQAGRCYLQVGNDEIYELFQSGWSGAVYDKNALENKAGLATMLTLTGKTAIVGSRTKMKRKEKERTDWYDTIIKTVQYIFRQSEFDKKLGELDLSERTELANTVSTVLSEQYDYGTSEADMQAVKNFIELMAKDENADGAQILKKHQADGMGRKLPELKEKTQLEVIVRYLKKLAEDNGFKNDVRLWLPLLPEELYLNKLVDSRPAEGKSDQFTLSAVIGMYDDPDNQLQLPVSVDFEASGHLALCGTVVSGKSTFIQTLIYSLANNYTAEELNFYIIDFSSRMLSCFEKLPHVGGVMYENDYDKIAKFFTMVDKIMNERQAAFGGGNYSQYVKAYGKRFPVVVIVLDNFANFREKTENAYDNMIMRIAREGVGYGVYLAVTSAGFGLNEIPTRIADNIRNVICLEMGDKYKYMEVLRVAHLSVTPEASVKGRGLVKVGDNILEFQTALSVQADDDYARAAKLEKWSEEVNASWDGRRAAAIPCIPEKPVYADLMNVGGCRQLLESRDLIPIGYMQADASVYCIDLSRTFCYFVSGKARSGKTNALKVILSGAARKNGKIVVIEKGSHELKKLAAATEARYIGDEKELFDFLSEIKTPFVERNKLKHSLVDEDKSEAEIYQIMSQEEPYFIFIASFEEFLSMVYDPPKDIAPMKGFVENIFDKGFLHNIYFFAGLDQENYSDLVIRDAYKYFTAGKTGIHLGGNIDKQRLINASNIPFTEQSKTMPKGMAIAPVYDEEGIVFKVILPLHGGDMA